ncbi:polyprenol phosphomannose-dependent alpha 1,6 mannosyltransferase MptB [Actinomadura sp. 3N407]|uniref:polyprenol phosphomannose-dependent alpha 1,6 mannosyltransferase MptB n=1 Tax=Actinomadura sp. 3N407 TaxID=3457423 RepID=UPI003FCE426B
MSILRSAGNPAVEERIPVKGGRTSRATSYAGLGLATLGVAVFIAGMLAGPSALVARWGADGPFRTWDMELSRDTMTLIAGTAALCGGLGTVIMLWSLRRGRVGIPPRLLLVGGTIIAVLMTVLPPAGSVDILNYAIYGRITDLGFDPYTMTPNQLRGSDDPVGILSPGSWGDQPTVYGPVATGVHTAAAWLGGSSMGWIVFWLKAIHLAAFLATAVMLDRLTAPDRAARARAAVLWTANPLVLFWMVGSGHADVIAAALLIGAVYVLRRSPERWSAIVPGLAAGVLAGAAVSVKATFALAVLGLGLACLRRPAVFVSGAAGAVACTGTAYLSVGESAVASLTKRLSHGDQFLPIPSALMARPMLYTISMGALTLIVAALVWWRLSTDAPVSGDLVLYPVAAFAIGSVIMSPVQYPWYAATFLPLLALLGPTRFDEILAVRFAALSCILLPGVGTSAAQFTAVRIAVPVSLVLLTVVFLLPSQHRRLRANAQH